jgi:hypothetical protein
MYRYKYCSNNNYHYINPPPADRYRFFVRYGPRVFRPLCVSTYEYRPSPFHPFSIMQCHSIKNILTILRSYIITEYNSHLLSTPCSADKLFFCRFFIFYYAAFAFPPPRCYMTSTYVNRRTWWYRYSNW